jgi:replication factor A1
MEDEIALTTGICQRLQESAEDDLTPYDTEPIVQFLSVKKVVGQNNNPDRYRAVMSDGQYWVQSIFATQMNHLVEEDLVGKNAIVRLDKFSCNHVQGKRCVACSESSKR